MKQNNFPDGSEGKKSAFNSGDPGFYLWVRKIPWRSEWLPIQVFLRAKFHGQRCLVGYSSWGCKE